MRRLVLVLAFVLSSTSCGKSGSGPTAPTPVTDNPTPPLVTCAVSWTPSPSTIVLNSPDEDFVVMSLYVSKWAPGVGAVQLLTDMPGGTTLHNAQPDTIHVTNSAQSGLPYVWLTGDEHLIQVNGHRPGQTTVFHLSVYSD